jgi:putative sterol carrier protein
VHRQPASDPVEAQEREPKMSLTPKQIFEEKIATRLKTNPDVAAKINSSYQFELTGDGGGSWAVDLTKKDEFVTSGTIENPKVTITMAAKDFVDLVEGRLNGQMAFMQGKLKLKGDMSLALKLQQLIG